MNQSSSNVFMIRPSSFRMNDETATNNHYQKALEGRSEFSIIENAQAEFDGLVKTLISAGIEVIVFEENADHDTPDAVFPNNWISTHEDGCVCLYPMYAKNRRLERREDIPLILAHQYHFNVSEIIDFTEFESHEKFLEGTGSMVLDRKHKKAYAALSERTDQRALEHFCEQMNYKPVAFNAFQTIDQQRLSIYHTNVMMSVGSGFAAICLDAIDDPAEKESVVQSLKDDGLEIIALDENQINQFAGNMLELAGSGGQPFVVMSEQGLNSLRPDQISAIEAHAQIISAPLPTIETLGGGSARCMIAEIHLAKK